MATRRTIVLSVGGVGGLSVLIFGFGCFSYSSICRGLLGSACDESEFSPTPDVVESSEFVSVAPGFSDTDSTGDDAVVISDSVFNPDDWTDNIEHVAQQATGGSTRDSSAVDTYWREMRPLHNLRAVGSALYTAKRYHPAVDGPIASIDYREDFIVFDEVSAQGRLALAQGNLLFGPTTSAFGRGDGAWHTVQTTGLEARNFHVINAIGISARPNFTDGEEITFGYIRGPMDGGEFDVRHGIDNWTVTIHRSP